MLKINKIHTDEGMVDTISYFETKHYFVNKTYKKEFQEFMCTYVVTHKESGLKIVSLSNFNKAKALCISLEKEFPFPFDDLYTRKDLVKKHIIEFINETEIKFFNLIGYNYF